MNTIDAVNKFTECYAKRNKTKPLKHFMRIVELFTKCR